MVIKKWINLSEFAENSTVVDAYGRPMLVSNVEVLISLEKFDYNKPVKWNGVTGDLTARYCGSVIGKLVKRNTDNNWKLILYPLLSILLETQPLEFKPYNYSSVHRRRYFVETVKVTSPRQNSSIPGQPLLAFERRIDEIVGRK